MIKLLRPVSLVALVLASLVLPGCVYYNTFYHAKAAAREAEILRDARPPDTEPTVREIELLDRAIEKSGRVLRLHPDSSWADDALLMLGTSLYHKGQYESAEERLTEFLTRYPNSELRAQAEYALAGARLRTGNPVSAEELLGDVAHADPATDISDDALVLMGEALRARGKREAAAEVYLELLQRFPRSDRRAEARFLAAENYLDMGRTAEAVEQYAAVVSESGSRELLFRARLRLAEAYLQTSDPGAALVVLRDLEGRAMGDDELDQVLLLVGRAQTLAGEFDSAISTYEGIAASRERTEAAAEAHYRIGLIHRDDLHDLAAALASFETAKSQAPRSETAALATSARDDLEELGKYLAIIEKHQAGGEAPAAEGAGAASTEAASAEHEVEPSVADTTAGPTPEERASRGDSAREAFRAAHASADTSAAEPDTEVALARFRVAELYLFHLDDPETALRYYDEVLTLNANSPQAPKAALAKAWLLENRLGDADAAIRAYEFVAGAFPGTEYAAAANSALGTDAGASEDEAAGDENVEPVAPDTSGVGGQ